jgi:hypothetical protein
MPLYKVIGTEYTYKRFKNERGGRDMLIYG